MADFNNLIFLYYIPYKTNHYLVVFENFYLQIIYYMAIVHIQLKIYQKYLNDYYT